jgi:E3 ubiquitin-protein ligase HUWE1
LCLNQAGQDQLSCHPSIIPSIFSIFTSDRHIKVLLDKENAVLIGTAIDELIRHHPSLKPAVFESLKSTLSKIEELGSSYVAPPDLQQWYILMPLTPGSNPDGDVQMEDIQPTDAVLTKGASELSEVLPEVPKSADEAVEDAALKGHDNTIVSYIDVIGRVITSLSKCLSLFANILISFWRACFSTRLTAKIL